MDLNFKNRTVLVTGSTKGIGFAAATQFAREGAKIIINGRKQAGIDEALAKLKKEVPNAQVSGIAADVGTEEGVQAIIKAAPSVDVLINNAGIFEPKNFPEIPRADWLKMFEVNVLSGARLTQHYLPGMLERDYGRVIFISSESALSIPVEMVHYGMSKTAQLAIARGAAEMCKGKNVTVNSVLPGPTFSEGVGDFVRELGAQSGKSPAEMEKEFFRDARPNSIAQRFAKVEEIADVIVFVASDRASMINGAAVKAEGGLVKTI